MSQPGRDDPALADGSTGIPTTPARSPHADYVKALDGLRGIAILLVVWAHCWRYPPGFDFLNGIASSGRIGVTVFFVLSGFLITRILWSSRADAGYYGNFFARRGLRIVPAYVVLMITLFLVLPPSKELQPVRDSWFLYVTFLSNLHIAMDGWHVTHADITWSLATEEQFYLLWPLLLRRVSRRTLIATCIALIVLTPIARVVAYQSLPTTPVNVLTPFNFDAFAMGTLCAVVLQDSLLDLRLFIRWARISLLVSLPISIAYVVADIWDIARTATAFGPSAIIATAGSVLVLALKPGRVASALQCKPLLHVGRVSYGIYLYHAMCLLVVSAALPAQGAPLVLSTLSVLGTAALSVAVATLSYRFLETPFLQLKRHFVTKPSGRRTFVAQAAEG